MTFIFSPFDSMMQKLPIPGRFLFRMEISCKYKENLENLNELPADYEFPDFESLEAQDSDSANSAKTFRVRGAWNENGVAFQFLFREKAKRSGAIETALMKAIGWNFGSTPGTFMTFIGPRATATGLSVYRAVKGRMARNHPFFCFRSTGRSSFPTIFQMGPFR